jgi:hypothetical protein
VLSLKHWGEKTAKNMKAALTLCAEFKTLGRKNSKEHEGTSAS